MGRDRKDEWSGCERKAVNFLLILYAEVTHSPGRQVTAREHHDLSVMGIYGVCLKWSRGYFVIFREQHVSCLRSFANPLFVLHLLGPLITKLLSKRSDVPSSSP